MISLLVVSDIHASANDLKNDDAVSWYSTLPEYDRGDRNPFVSIPDLLKAESLKVDLILCPGDLADCANPTAQDKAWASLALLQQKIGARRLVGTAGNHDVDSRAKFSEFDPKTTLQSLTPPFPGLPESECDFFWSRNFAIFEENDVRFVVLNSAAFHGIHSGEKDNLSKEYLHGRVSDRTISALAEKLSTGSFALNILLLHHHIYKNEHISDTDYSEMKNGQALVRKLGEKTQSPWLIIHGHQHYPDLFYAPGDSRSPVVLSAGSMSRRLSGALSQRALNQIYHLELPTKEYASIGWHPCGIVRSWHWTDKIGWTRTQFGRPEIATVPFGAGFGCRKNPDAWATEINTEFVALGSNRTNWSELVQKLPALKYVLPADLRAILQTLRDKHSLKALSNDDGYPEELGRK
jgi:hypothetical protein